MRKVFRGFQRSGLFWQILATLLLLASHHPQHQCLAWQIPPIRIASSSSSQRSLSLAQAKNDNDSDPPAVFPLSTRAALIQNAKSLDIQLATGSKLGSYSPQGWSNRLGTVLTPASIPGVYTGDRPFLWNGIDVSCRMVVVQLQTPNNQDKPDLWIHSPVGLDAPLKAALATLGRVKYVVSPNYEHLKFAPQWAQEYPDAQMWGCPGLVERMPDIQWAGEIPNGIRPSSWTTGDNNKVQQLENCWDLNEIEPLHINVEVNPATGTPFFNEVIFFHKPSQTLITTDLVRTLGLQQIYGLRIVSWMDPSHMESFWILLLVCNQFDPVSILTVLPFLLAFVRPSSIGIIHNPMVSPIPIWRIHRSMIGNWLPNSIPFPPVASYSFLE